MKKILTILVSLIIVAVATFFLRNYFRTEKTEPSPDKQIAEQKPVQLIEQENNTPFSVIPNPIEEVAEEESEEDLEEEQKTDWGIEAILAEWDYQPEIHPFSFDFLWEEEPKDELDSVKWAFTFAPNIELYMIGIPYWFMQNPDEFRDFKNKKGRNAYHTILTYLYDYRAKADLPSIAEAYLDLLPLFISRQTYEEKYFGEVVRQLLIAYNNTLDGTEEFERFGYIYNRMLENEEMDVADESYDEEKMRYYYDIAEIANVTRHINLFRYSPDDKDIHYGRLIWAYSFWGRRYMEGIHQDVYYILKRIESVYQ